MLKKSKNFQIILWNRLDMKNKVGSYREKPRYATVIFIKSDITPSQRTIWGVMMTNVLERTKSLLTDLVGKGL